MKPDTVRYFMRSLSRKLGAKGRAQIIAKAIARHREIAVREGLVEAMAREQGGRGRCRS